VAADLPQLRDALAGRYRLESEIGAGGMGSVHRATDLRHGRPVAIKVLKPDVAAALGSARFLREIELAARLSHPHVLPVYDSGNAGGMLYFVMPLVEGESLREKLDREGPLAVEESARIAREVADALAYAHARNIVHRDIKPANILIHGGHAVVADFGVARAIEAAGGETLTQTGVMVGTPAYMSPEQAVGSGKLDARSDLYSLGCVLFEMLAGRPPFVGTSAESLVYQQVSAAPPALEGIRPGLPPALGMIVSRLLAKVPADRYADAAALARDLVPAALEAPIAPRTTRRTRTAPRAWVAGAGGLVAAGVALWAALAGPCRPHPAEGAIRSLAVMPLENLSGDATQEYFVDGMTEELINHLSRIRSLRVISRTSVMSLKGEKLAIPDIARRLKVDGIVDGSVARLGDQVKVSAALVQSSPERQLWAQSYERQARDVLALQSELADAISQELRLRLTPAERVRVARAGPTSPEAHEACLKGRFYLNKREEAALRTALQYFQQAVAIDPLYAQGWAGVAETYYDISSIYLPASRAMPLARAAAEKALQLDSTLAEAHATLGVVRYGYDWDWPGAEREFQRALQLNPSLAEAHQYYGSFLESMGRFDESFAEYQRDLQLNPLSAYDQALAYWPLYLAGRNDEAIAAWTAQANVDPNDVMLLYNLGMSYLARGENDRAIATLQKSVAGSDFPFPLALLSIAYAKSGRRAEARGCLDRMKVLASKQHVGAMWFAFGYAWLGEKDEAFRWLDKAYETRDEDMVHLAVDPKLAPLRSDPRFQALLRRMKLAG
jgi:serine/threonine-protein kinase